MPSKLSHNRIVFVLSWTLVNAFCWPAGLLLGILLGFGWIRLLANLIPGRLELGTGFIVPNHQHIQVFVWSAMLIGGAIMGLVVGVSQYWLLRKYYGITSRWIFVSILGWSLAGFFVKVIESFSNLNPLSDRWIYALLITIPFGVGASVTGRWLGKVYINHQKRILFIFMYCFTIMLGGAAGWLLGPFPLVTALSTVPMEIIGFVGFGIFIGGFSSIAFVTNMD